MKLKISAVALLLATTVLPLSASHAKTYCEVLESYSVQGAQSAALQIPSAEREATPLENARAAKRALETLKPLADISKLSTAEKYDLYTNEQKIDALISTLEAAETAKTADSAKTAEKTTRSSYGAYEREESR